MDQLGKTTNITKGMYHSSSSLYRKGLIDKCCFHLFHYIFADRVCYCPLRCRERLFQRDECMVTEYRGLAVQCKLHSLINYGFQLTFDDLNVLRVTVQISAIKDIT